MNETRATYDATVHVIYVATANGTHLATIRATVHAIYVSTSTTTYRATGSATDIFK